MKGFLLTMLATILSYVVQTKGECNEIINYGANLHGRVVNNFGACSGQGECVNVSSGELGCKCKDGWTGLSDWVNTEGEDCQINEWVIKGLWAVDAVLIVLVYVRAGPVVYGRWKGLQHQKEVSRSRGIATSKLAERSVYGLLGFYCATMPLLFTLALVRIFADNERVGVTIPLTTLYLLIKISFYISTVLFQPSQLTIFITSSFETVSDELKFLVKVSNVCSIIFSAFSIGISFLVVGPIVQPESSPQFYATYTAGLALSFVWYGTQAVLIKSQANKVLKNMAAKGDGGVSTQLADTVRVRIGQIENEVIVQTVVQFFLFMATFSIAFLYNKHDYYLPIVWIAMITLPYKAAMTHVSVGNDSSNSKVRLTRIGASSKAKGSKDSLALQKQLSEVSTTSKDTKGSKYVVSDSIL